MKLNINIKHRGHIYSQYISLPNQCPHCGSIINPVYYTSCYIDDSKDYFGVLVRCPASNCNRFFALEYSDTGISSTLKNYKRYDYRPPITTDLPDNIEKISPVFVEIYSQATRAESEKLDQLAGVGYRKALEFLIKDYSIRKNPHDENKIKKMTLNSVIMNYLSDFPKLQNLAKAATWIGNDETHYVRINDDKDIRDMKQFIKSASLFITADYDADLANDFISKS